MIYMNSKMRDSFNEVCSHENLSTELSCILDKGFVEINKCVFFSWLWRGEYSNDITIDNIKEQFLDFSGYEFSINKIYIEDYIHKNVKKESFVLLMLSRINGIKSFLISLVSCFCVLKVMSLVLVLYSVFMLKGLVSVF